MRCLFLCLCATLSLLLGCNSVSNAPTGPRVVASLNFDDKSELDNWNLTSYSGKTDLDSVIKFEGKSAIHFLPQGSCYTVDRKLGIPVTTNANYKVEFNFLMDSTSIPQVFCAGSFILIIRQGNQEVLYQDFEDAPVWETKSAYFKAQNDLPVNVYLIIQKQVWIDNLNFIQEL